MDFAVLTIFAVLAYLFYVNDISDREARQKREKYLRDPKNIPDSLQKALKSRHRLDAIKEYRALYGAGLKEAEDFVSNHC